MGNIRVLYAEELSSQNLLAHVHDPRRTVGRLGAFMLTTR